MHTQQTWAFRYRGLIGFLVLGSAAAVALLSEPLIREGSWQDIAADFVAWVAFVLGALLRIWATLYVGGRKYRTLMSDGPYSMCRNPLYLGTFLLAIALGLFLKSVTLAVAIAFVFVAYALATIPAEERALRQNLGEQYSEYYRRVPRLWPRLSLFHTPDVIEVKVKGLRIELKRGLLSWMWLPFFGELMSHLRVLSFWPHYLHLP